MIRRVIMYLMQSLAVEHRLEQMLKLELRQELKVLLRRILRLLAMLRLGQRLTLVQVYELADAIRKTPRGDLLGLAHETVRRSGLESGNAFAHIMSMIAVRTCGAVESRHIHVFAEALESTVDAERSRRADVGQSHGHYGGALVLSLIVMSQDPDRLFPFEERGSADELLHVLRSFPQRRGTRVVWALTGAWAVELLTAVTQAKDGVDAIVIDISKRDAQRMIAVNGHGGDYRGTFKDSLDRSDTRLVTTVGWSDPSGHRRNVAVMCPEFILLSKILGGALRGGDWDHVRALVEHFAGSWNNSILHDLFALRTKETMAPDNLLALLATRDTAQILVVLRRFWGIASATT